METALVVFLGALASLAYGQYTTGVFSMPGCSTDGVFKVDKGQPPSITCTGLISSYNIRWYHDGAGQGPTVLGNCLACTSGCPDCKDMNTSRAVVTREATETTLRLVSPWEDVWNGEVLRCSSHDGTNQAWCRLSVNEEEDDSQTINIAAPVSAAVVVVVIVIIVIVLRRRKLAKQQTPNQTRKNVDDLTTECMNTAFASSETDNNGKIPSSTTGLQQPAPTPQPIAPSELPAQTPTRFSLNAYEDVGVANESDSNPRAGPHPPPSLVYVDVQTPEATTSKPIGQEQRVVYAQLQDATSTPIGSQQQQPAVHAQAQKPETSVKGSAIGLQEPAVYAQVQKSPKTGNKGGTGGGLM